MKTSKEILKELVDFLRIAKKFETQSELSVDAGLRPQTLTQAISKKDGHEAVIKKLKIIYRDLLKKSIWDDQKPSLQKSKIALEINDLTFYELLSAVIKNADTINSQQQMIKDYAEKERLQTNITNTSKNGHPSEQSKPIKRAKL